MACATVEIGIYTACSVERKLEISLIQRRSTHGSNMSEIALAQETLTNVAHPVRKPEKQKHSRLNDDMIGTANRAKKQQMHEHELVE